MHDKIYLIRVISSCWRI